MARCALGVESLDGAFDGDQHGVAIAILGLGGGDLHPTFADAVLLDIGAYLAIEADANLVFEALGHMVRAARVGGKVVGQCWFGVAHLYRPEVGKKCVIVGNARHGLKAGLRPVLTTGYAVRIKGLALVVPISEANDLN